MPSFSSSSATTAVISTLRGPLRFDSPASQSAIKTSSSNVVNGPPHHPLFAATVPHNQLQYTQQIAQPQQHASRHSSTPQQQPIGPTTPVEDQLLVMLCAEVVYTPSLCAGLIAIGAVGASPQPGPQQQSRRAAAGDPQADDPRHHERYDSLGDYSASSTTVTAGGFFSAASSSSHQESLSSSTASPSPSASSTLMSAAGSVPNHVAWRSKICEWCYRVMDHFRYDREIVSVAMNYFDRYLVLQLVEQQHAQAQNQSAGNSTLRGGDIAAGGGGDGRATTAAAAAAAAAIDSRTYQLAAMTALYVAVKLHADQIEAVAATSDCNGNNNNGTAAAKRQSMTARPVHNSDAITNSTMNGNSTMNANSRRGSQVSLNNGRRDSHTSLNNGNGRRDSHTSLHNGGRRDSHASLHNGGRRDSHTSLARSGGIVSRSGSITNPPNTSISTNPSQLTNARGGRNGGRKSIPATPSAPTRKLRLSSFVELSRGQFSGRDITDMEMVLLKTLKWRVNPPTPMVFVSHLLRVMPTFVAYDFVGVGIHPRDQDQVLPRRQGQGGIKMVSPISSPSSSSSSPVSPAAAASSSIQQDPAKHRTLVLHVLHELSRYLAELSICLPDVSTTNTPGTIAYAAILISLDLLSTTTAVPYSVRQAYLQRIDALSQGRLHPQTAAVATLKTKMCDSFVSDMLEDSLAEVGGGRHGLEGDSSSGGSSGHPIVIAREAGLLSPDVERRCYGGGGYYAHHQQPQHPPHPSAHQPPTAMAVEDTEMKFNPSRQHPQGLNGDGEHPSFDCDSLDGLSNTSVASFDEEDAAIAGNNNASAEFASSSTVDHRHHHQDSYTVVDSATGFNRSVNCVVEEAALQQKRDERRSANKKEQGTMTSLAERSAKFFQAEQKQQQQQTSMALSDAMLEQNQTSSSGGRPGHVRSSSWMSDSSESPVSVIGNLAAEAMAGVGSGGSSNSSTASGKRPPTHHQQQLTGYLL